jgi:pimeloyl-ACP methyl ester carboxylesterase
MKHGRRRLRIASAALSFCVAAYLLVGWLRPGWVLQAEYARLCWLAGASKHAVRVDGHRIVYVQAGRGRTIVLLHGFTGSKENWLPLMRRLAKSYRVIAPDLPGWGESTRLPGADYGPVAQAERMRDFLQVVQGAVPAAGAGAGAHSAARGPYRPPTLTVGHSMGGQILGLLAVRHPDAVNRIVLMDAAGVPFDANAFGRDVLAGKNPFEVTTRAELKRYVGIVFADPPWIPWPADRALVQMRARQAAFEQGVLDRIGRGPEALLLGQRLGEVRAPTLLLWCRDDHVIDVSAMEVFRRGIRNNRVALFDGCGHMPMMQQPDATAAAIDAFVRSSPRPRPGAQSVAAR